MGFDRFSPLKSLGIYVQVYELRPRERVCILYVYVLRCAQGMCSSVKNVKAKQNHLRQPKKSWIEAFLSGFLRFHPAAIFPLFPLSPCLCKDSGNISNNSGGSAVHGFLA